MSQIEIKKVFGLELQSNSYLVREGSFEILENCTLVQDDIVSKRSGKRLFKTLGAVEGKTLAEYQAKLLCICDDRIEVYTQNSAGELVSTAVLSGETVAVSGKSRTAQSNGNMYFTTDNGILKLESVTAPVLTAGIDPATDIQIITQAQSDIETFFTPDSQIAYRVLFGRKDANNNFVLGAPSQVAIATNPIATASSASIAGSTVTVNTIAPHLLAVSDVVYIKDADGTGVPDGIYTVATTPDADTFTFAANSGSGVSTLKWGTFKIPTLDFAVPPGINSTEFLFQLYRSTTSVEADVSPDESTLQLVEELNLTTEQISTGFVIYRDETPDILRGQFLYTNPNTGEARGILEANEKPPYSTDLAVFKNHVFYSNVLTNFNLSLNLITSDATTMPDLAEFKITSVAGTRTYIGHAYPKVGNRTVRATSVSNVLAVVTITYNGHGFSNGDTIAVAEALDSSNNQLATLPQGNYTVAGVTANTFEITAPATPTGLTELSFSGVSNAAGKRIFYIEHSSASTVAAAIDATARAIVRAVNRDPSAPCYGYYVSSVTDIPGKMIFRSVGLTDTFYFNNITAAIAESFSPILATTGQAVIGTRDDGAGVAYFSKPNEPEAVPLANQRTIGSKSAAILRVIALRDSLIFIKEDGVYRVNGDDYASFVATALDTTVVCQAADSVVLLNNAVFCLAEQGVAEISETSARVVSEPIKPLLKAVTGKDYLSSQTHAVSYETESLYLMTTVKPNSTVSDVVYVYNAVNGGWSTWDTVFTDAFVRPTDSKLYHIALDNVINQERKNQNRLDFCDQDYVATILTVPTANTATMIIVGGVAAVGDILVIDDIISRITQIESVGGTLVYTFARDVSFAASDVGLLYKAIPSRLRTSPVTGGEISRLKQYSEFQADFRNDAACSRAELYFITDSVPGSTSTTWIGEVSNDGWGNASWGQFPWGQEEGINSVYETNPASILRTYVPLDVSRGTFIQVDLTHASAAENLLLQSMAFTARIYGQRTTR